MKRFQHVAGLVALVVALGCGQGEETPDSATDTADTPEVIESEQGIQASCASGYVPYFSCIPNPVAYREDSYSYGCKVSGTFIIFSKQTRICPLTRRFCHDDGKSGTCEAYR